MSRVVRRFYTIPPRECINTLHPEVLSVLTQFEADPTTATESAEMVLTDDGKLVMGTLGIVARKRIPEEIFYDESGVLNRFSSKKDYSDFVNYWKGK